MPIQNSISNAIKGFIINGGGPAADFSTKSLSFDGIDDYVSTQEVYSELDGQNKMTLSLWMKPISGAPLYEYVVTVPRNSIADQHVFSFQHFENNYLLFSIDGRTTKSILGNISAINYGQWNHILCCLDGTLSGGDRMRIYVNGVDESYNPNIGTFTALQNASGGLMIGEEPQGSYNPYKGFLDEVAIWSGVDLRNDVATIYNNGKPADLTSLNPTSWYRAGESSTFAYPQILMPEDTNKDKVSKYSFAFDGLGYVDCGDPDEFSFTSGKADSRFSISAWVYMNDATRFRVLSKINSSSNAEYAFYTSAADQLYFVLYTNSTSNRISRYTSATLTSYEGQWIHLAATYDGSGTSNGLKIYLNGNRVDDTTSDVGVYAAMLNTNAPLTIGKYQDVTSTYANGKIDEAAVFGFDLGQSAVQAIYNSGIPTDISSYSPVGYWKLGEEAKFTNNWLVPNSALSNFSKYSFNFDGLDDYIDCGNGASLQITGALTLSAWVKMSSTSGQSQDCIISKDNGNAERSFSLWGKTSFSIGPAGYVWNGATYYEVQATTNIEDDNWHHVMLVYVPSTSLSIYIDGNLNNTNTTSIPSSINNANQNINIGRFGGGTFQLTGNIDEVAIWNSDQSAAATAIYNGGKPKDLSGFSPVSWWRMGEEATYDGGTNQFTIPDQGSGGNTGTSSNTMLLETLVGDTPQYYGGGISDSMDIFDRVGDAPVFTNNFSLEFDGADDYVSIPTITLPTDFSVSMWVKATTGGSVRDQVFGGPSGFFLFGTTVLSGGLLSNKMCYVNGGSYVALTPTLRDGNWHNIVITYNSSATNLKAYTDGVETYNATYDAGTNNVIDRISEDTYGNYWKGNLDELAVWTSELSPSDVSSIYNSGVPNNLNDLSTSPLSWWRFEEGSGTTAKDSGSGGNDGTLTNGPLYDTDRILATKANNTVSFNMEEADIVEDTP